MSGAPAVDDAPRKETEKFEFDAEVPQLLSIIINCVYSSKDLFLRELISNSSDALSKMLAQKETLDREGYTTIPFCDYKIQLIVDRENRTLTIKDNGVGMTKVELISCLGCIASSGTRKFREALDKAKGSNIDGLIGQFGLGFYSAFLVADRVDVITKSVKDQGYHWSSDNATGYMIEPCEVAEEHGTSVILRLREGMDEFLAEDRLSELVKKHSMFIDYKIYLITEATAEKKEEAEAELDGEELKEVEQIKDEEKEEEKTEDQPDSKKRKMTEKLLNFETPIWNKKVSDIPEADLKTFYKHISNDYDDYAAVQSWHFEGSIDLKILLFIPKRAKLGFFEKQDSKRTNIKLYNSRVLVEGDLGESVIPDWMSFVVGAVSSMDFPMNLSREFVQGSAVPNLLKNKLPKCIAEMIRSLENDEKLAASFYKEFSPNIKLAVRQYSGTQQETFAKFLRYPTNQSTKPVTFDEYLALVPETQKQILILTGLSKQDVESSIYLQGFKDRHVLLMSEAIDEIMLQSFKTYKDMPLQMISAEGVESIDADETVEDFNALKDFIQENFKENVEKVVLSRRFPDVPIMLLTTKYASSSTMENMIKSHPGSMNDPMAMMMLRSKKILEINVNNPIVQAIKRFFDEGQTEKVKEYVGLLFDASLFGCGFSVSNKASFVKNFFSIFAEAISKEAPSAAAGDAAAEELKAEGE